MNEKQIIGSVSKGVKVKRAIWNVAYCIFFRPFVTKLFRPWRIALLKMFGAKISWNAEVYASAKVWAPWNLEMEAGSCIGPSAICYNQAKVVMKQDACLSQYAYVCTAGHQTQSVNNAQNGLVVAPVVIENGAWIGTRAYINMGVVIGERAVVGACACVFKDVAPNTIVGGNPAVVLK